MKKLQLSFIFLILFSLSSINSNAQELNYSELTPKKTSFWKPFIYKSYVSKDGGVYKIGDRLKILTPSSNKTFAFINVAGAGGTNLDISASGHETIIESIRNKGNKNIGYSAEFRTKGYSFLSEYDIDIENAIAAGEIKSFVTTSDEALSLLKKAKDKLDLQLITQQKYDSIKIELVKYIK